VAVFSGPTATIQNSAPLLTSNKARRLHGLPLLADAFGAPHVHDAVRPQRLAAPVKVFVEYGSAHPLETDSTELAAPPDGHLDAAGAFVPLGTGPPPEGGTPVYAVELEPADGLLMLPYMGRQADGTAWDGLATTAEAAMDQTRYTHEAAAQTRQCFYPDASRIYEEIDRFGVSGGGEANMLSSMATYEFFRPAPSAGWRKGRSAALRTDVGEGDIAPEKWGEDFFMYFPRHLQAEPPITQLAIATNVVAKAMATGEYIGGQWLEGSPTTEESMYWLNLLIDTKHPLVGHSAQRPHGTVSSDGPKNILDGVRYITSAVWKHGGDADVVGAVMIVDEQVFHSREVAKTDARPGNYVATGGHGGVVAQLGAAYGQPQLSYIPAKKHTWCSDVNLSRLPRSVPGLAGADVVVTDGAGFLLPAAMPTVTFAKYGRYMPRQAEVIDEGGPPSVEIMARVRASLGSARVPLAGFVGEGSSPYGTMDTEADAALRFASFSGMPVVRVGRGNTAGMTSTSTTSRTEIAGNNLTATKARLLLMACMLKLGALPAAADPSCPTVTETTAVEAKVEQFQAIFDTH
jgi:hypothetical protein